MFKDILTEVNVVFFNKPNEIFSGIKKHYIGKIINLL